MNESDALAVSAVRAIETADREHAAWTDADRAWASRAAAEVVGESAAPEAFIAKRAGLACDRLAQRKDAIVRFARAWRWRPWVGVVIGLAAFVVGIVSNVIGGAPHVNILYSPVLPLVVWNLAVYVVLAGGYVVRFGDDLAPGPLRRAVVWLAGGLRRQRRGRDDVSTRARATFADDWAARAGPLYAARAARLLHVASALLALGVIAGLYLRGLGLEYRATWESTFLEPATVRAIVAAFYAAGAWATGLAVPDVAHVAAIRAPASENAALWLHLMAATLAVLVIAPRALLAIATGIVERHRARNLIPAVSDPYFARLLRGFTNGPVIVDAVPYSFAVRVDAGAVLESLLGRSLGGNVKVRVAPPVAYGDDGLPPEVPRGSAHPVVGLFNATATPEKETHGAFLASLAALERPLAVVIDEAAIAARFGGDARRREERRELWRTFASEHAQHAIFIDLACPDLQGAEAAFDAALR